MQKESITELARVSAIADVFDALTSKRAYKDPVNAQDALKIMTSMQPGKFDAELFKFMDKGLYKKKAVVTPAVNMSTHKKAS